MKAKLIREAIKFERGLDSKKSLDVGLTVSLPQETEKLMSKIENHLSDFLGIQKFYTSEELDFPADYTRLSILLDYHRYPEGSEESMISAFWINVYEISPIFRGEGKFGDYGVASADSEAEFFKNIVASLGRDQGSLYKKFSGRIDLIQKVYES